MIQQCLPVCLFGVYCSLFHVSVMYQAETRCAPSFWVTLDHDTFCFIHADLLCWSFVTLIIQHGVEGT